MGKAEGKLVRAKPAPDWAEATASVRIAHPEQRERRGLTLADMAAALGYSTSGLVSVRERSPFHPSLPSKLDELLGHRNVHGAMG